MRKLNLMGQRFGHLTVIGPASPSSEGPCWSCQCDCGKCCVKVGKELTKPERVHSCGCRPALAKSIQKRLHAQQRLDLLKR